MSNRRYVVMIDQPRDVSDEQMAEYIKLAIANWGAGVPPPPPDSPFFDLDVLSVTAVHKAHKD
ncbi:MULTISPECIES: hypothetical protein [unclassified Cupriavidus]|uniref:hypothetical protein n=1 Tax=unclassified Cupriavidus TaxID=2640874 RepID=UPI0003676967|nr:MULTISPECIES: hypothetical protein [unclassified Cupriavidus]MBP0630507.1 hypothetical protein [Cupriavidus sp. AcVe19-1a]UIF87430.1 hypothetical protein KAF44_07950 [Cupriavidus necator]